MDDKQVVDLLLRLLEKVAALESKIDSNNSLHADLKEDVKKLEGRVCNLENAPGKKWNTLTTAIISGIGGLIAGGAGAAVVTALNK